MGRLLIIACSQRKKATSGTLPAIERYDGPAFRVLRKFIEASTDDGIVVLVLSARFGLISCNAEIPNYNVRMTPASAKRLRSDVLEALGQVIASGSWTSIGLCLGKAYLPALEGFEWLVPGGTQVTTIGGGLGQRLTNLHRWLQDSQVKADRHASEETSLKPRLASQSR